MPDYRPYAENHRDGKMHLYITFFFMVTCQSIVYPLVSQKLSGKLLLGSEISKGVVRFNTTVNGTCEVTDGLDSSFNISQLRITSIDGSLLPLEHLGISSDHSIHFIIPNIPKSQFGLYKCIYNASGRIQYVATKYIHVLAEPLEVKSLHFVVNNWEHYNITMVPSLQEQDRQTHDQKDTFVRLHTKVKFDYTNKCPNSGGNVVVPRNCTSDRICRTLGQCCNYSCNCNNDNCSCNYNDRPGLTDVTTCFGVKVWTDILGEPEAYNKVFPVNLDDYVKPSPVDERTIRLDVINSTSFNISWHENGMWSFRGKRRVQYNVLFEAANFKHMLNISNLRQPFLTQTDLIPHGRYQVSVIVKPLELGIPSDAAITDLTMPESVPSRNPSFIGHSVVNHDEIKTVTLYWKPLSEIEKNGFDVQTEVELDGQPFCATTEESSCSGDIPAETNYSVARIYSKSMSLGRNISAPISAMKIAGAVGARMNLEVSRSPDAFYNTTLRSPNGKNAQVRAMIVMCEKDAKENKCSDKAQLDCLGNVYTGVGAFSLGARTGFNPYKIGVILDEKRGWNLIEWSPCIYEQGKVPSRPVVSFGKPLPPEKLMVHVEEYNCNKNTGTGVKVSKITGHYCPTSEDERECIGKTSSIEINKLGEWTTYNVDAGLYRVSLQAVAEDGSTSPEWTDTVDVPPKGMNLMYILAGPISVVAVAIVIIIGKWVHWREEQKHSQLPIAKPSIPKVPIAFDEHQERSSAPPSPINRCHLVFVPKPVTPSRVEPKGNNISFKPTKTRIAKDSTDDYAKVVMKHHQDFTEADDSSSRSSDDDSSYVPDTSSTSGFGSGRSNQPFETSTIFSDQYHLENDLTNGMPFDGDEEYRYPDSEHDITENHEQKTSGTLQSADKNQQACMGKLTDEFPMRCFRNPQEDPKEVSKQDNFDNVLMPPSTKVYPGDSCTDRIPYERSASGTSGESLSGASREATTASSGVLNKEGSYAKVTVNNSIFENSAQVPDPSCTCLPVLDDMFGGLGGQDFRGKAHGQQNGSEEGREMDTCLSF